MNGVSVIYILSVMMNPSRDLAESGAACPGLRRARPRLHLSPQERCSALKRTERDLLKRVLKDTWFTYFEPPRFLLQKWDSRGFCGACAWVSTWGG